MTLLLDTHVLLWLALEPEKLSATAERLTRDGNNQLFFSLASIWEVAIKFGRKRGDFTTHPLQLRRGLLDARFQELPIRSEHVAAVLDLPKLHGDPFDRLLIAQAIVEGMQFLTGDEMIHQYPGPILKV